MYKSTKKIKRSVSFDPELLDTAQQEAETRYGGNLSALIAQALTNSTNGNQPTPKATDSNPLIRLANSFLPTSAPTLQEWAAKQKGTAQADLIVRLLHDLMWAIRLEPDADPTEIKIVYEPAEANVSEDKSSYAKKPVKPIVRLVPPKSQETQD